MSKPCALPQELIDNITDLVEPSCYKAASLVCRAWLISTRRHLLCTLIVNSDKPERSLRALTLVLRQDRTVFRWTTKLEMHGLASFPHVLYVIAELERLSSLHFLQTKFIEIPYPLPPLARIPPSRRMKDISFTDTAVLDVCPPWEVKLYFVYYFHSLEKLHIEAGVSSGDKFNERTLKSILEDVPNSHHTKITSTLIISNSGRADPVSSKYLLDRLLRSFDLRDLTALSITMFPLACCVEYAPLIHEVASTLTTIILDLRYPAGEDQISGSIEVWTAIGLSQCRSLQSVRLVFHSPNTHASIWHHVMDLIEIIPQSAPLRQLTLQTAVYYPGGIDSSTINEQMPWARMQDVILHHDGITNVVLTLADWDYATHAGLSPALVREMMPRLNVDCQHFGQEWDLD